MLFFHSIVGLYGCAWKLSCLHHYQYSWLCVEKTLPCSLFSSLFATVPRHTEHSNTIQYKIFIVWSFQRILPKHTHKRRWGWIQNVLFLFNFFFFSVCCCSFFLLFFCCVQKYLNDDRKRFGSFYIFNKLFHIFFFYSDGLIVKPPWERNRNIFMYLFFVVCTVSSNLGNFLVKQKSLLCNNKHFRFKRWMDSDRNQHSNPEQF